MQPAGQHHILRQRTGLAREIGEYNLRDVLCLMGIAVRPPERGGIDEVYVTPDQFAEGGFGSFISVALEQLMVVQHLFSLIIQPQTGRTGQKNSGVDQVGRESALRCPRRVQRRKANL